MAQRLALALDGGTPQPRSAVLSIDRRTAALAARAGGTSVLLYQLVSDSLVVFRGTGRIAALEYGAERGPVICRIDSFRAFETPVVSEAEARLPRVRMLLLLSDERVAEVLREGRSPGGPPALEEQAIPFSDDQAYATIESQVLERWRFTCAVTGERYDAKVPATRLFVVPIRPRPRGGPLHARNYLPMVEPAARAWTLGHISAGPQLDFLAVLDQLDAGLLERMRREGKLLVPGGVEFGPDPDHLAYHRTHVFAH
jgi:hypothetical protein